MQPDKIIRSNRKTLALQIDENARLIVRAPHHVSQKRIARFIDEKHDWILKSQDKVRLIKEDIEKSREIKDGSCVLYLGREYEIRLNGQIKDIILESQFMEFPFSKIEHAENYLISWYRKRAKEIIIPRAEEIADKINLDYSKIGITSAKKRWGSCNSKGSINFSYRLVTAPPGVIDYVIVHEFMHLKEMNHSKNFWRHVESIVPDYKQRRKWLKENQHRIII